MNPEDRFRITLSAARDGDQSAWAEIYRDLAPTILGYLRARGAPDPEDLLGEVFLHVVRDLSQFQGGERELRAWVLRIAHNRLVDDVRRRGRRRESPLPDHDLHMAAGDGAEVVSADAAQEAMERISTAEVGKLVATLSPDQQAVVLLRVLGGLSISEVAQILGKRKGAVKALQHRAIAAIEREMRRRGD